ncbi:ATP-binding protein [Marinicellulosiphila megalodicopiae]|uniref:ATP-binding protein n=1 Tax=Marinicellulosiphila megalodicopiae TaxID=2724896 RepID=UPI003BB0E8DA
MSKIFNSLQSRLLISAFFLLIIFCISTGFALNKALYNSVIASGTDTLHEQKINILELSEIRDNNIYLPLRPIGLLAFNDENSSIFGLAFDDKDSLVWKSWSSRWVPDLDNFTNNFDPSVEAGTFQDYFYINELVTNTDLAGNQVTFRLVVFQSLENFNIQQQAFRKQMYVWLASLTVFLLLVLGTIIFWGLKPLGKVAIDLKRIKQGKSEFLLGKYPSEVEPVITNLNALIEAERAQRERYKKTLGDLAHSLKTPLAVMNSLEVADKQSIIHEQIKRMDDIISYQLNRAVISHKNKSITQIDIFSSVERIVNALNKAYQDKGVKIDVAFDHCMVPINEDDAMEVFGNLIENAFKYTDNQIKISCNEASDVTQIIIEDNGPGIAQESRQVILQRGERADTQQTGQGIGLSVVVDILSSYNAGISIEQSDLGGAKFVMSF